MEIEEEQSIMKKMNLIQDFMLTLNAEDAVLMQYKLKLVTLKYVCSVLKIQPRTVSWRWNQLEIPLAEFVKAGMNKQ